MSFHQSLVGFVLRHFTVFDGTVLLLTCVSGLLGAVLTYVFQAEREHRGIRDFGRYCFPSIILRHPSCRTDVLFMVATRVFDHLFFVPLMLTGTVCGLVTYGVLAQVFGHRAQNPQLFWQWGLLLVGAIVIQDFMTFYIHFVMHKIMVLWEFHKTHHAAEFLIPITNRRFHPVQKLVDHVGATVPVGLFLGIACYIWSLSIVETTILGLDAFFTLNMLSFYHLRHSHIYMRYGWLERYLLSPAQHQLHHSQEVEHWDKNFGLFFSVWDRWFGTIVYTRSDDVFRVGLPAEHAAEFDSVWKLHVTPLVNTARMAAAWVRTARRPGVAAIQAIPVGND